MEKKVRPNNLEEFVKTEGPVQDWMFEEDESVPPKPCSWLDLNALSFPDNRWLVRNLVPKEGITIFASISGEGKSLLIMHLAKCISEGTPWFGNEDFKTEQARVLYVNLEMSLSEMQRRGRKIGFDSSNDNLIILNEDNFNLNEGPGKEDLKYKWLLNYIHDQKIKVVIIDTFRAASGGLKEEKAEEVRHFFQKFLILKNSGVSIIILEHVRKPSQLEGKIPKKEQLLGSQDKTANAEILLMIRRDEGSGNIHIYQRKNRLGNEINPFAVKMSDAVDPDGTERLEFEYIGELDDEANKKEEAKELVLQILSSGDMKNRKELEELTKKHVGSKNLRQALKEMHDGGDIDFVKEGKRHVYFIPKDKALPQEEVLSPIKTEDFIDT